MKIKYYTKHFSFILPMCIVCFLLNACGRLGASYEGPKSNTDVDAGHEYEKNSNTDDTPVKNLSFKELSDAIGNDDVGRIKELCTELNEKGLDNLFKMNPENMQNLLHIAAENIGTNAVAIMKLLLDTMRPLLLSKEGRESLLCEENKIKYFVQGSHFWNENTMKDALKYLQRKGYNNSALLRRNDAKATPLLRAAKIGSLELFKLLLEYTHQCVGLNLTDHIDEDKNDFLDIALQEQCFRKLDCIMYELWRCSDRFTNLNCMHFSGMSKCHSEAVIRAIVSSKKQLKCLCLFRAVNNNKLEQIELLLHTILTVLGPTACLRVFIKKCPCKPSGYTLLHTALDKNVLEAADREIVEYLTGLLLSTLKAFTALHSSHPLKKQLSTLLANPEGRKNMLNVIDLAKEHKCQSALCDLYEILRILELETPPTQWWGLTPNLPER